MIILDTRYCQLNLYVEPLFSNPHVNEISEKFIFIFKEVRVEIYLDLIDTSDIKKSKCPGKC